MYSAERKQKSDSGCNCALAFLIKSSKKWSNLALCMCAGTSRVRDSGVTCPVGAGKEEGELSNP